MTTAALYATVATALYYLLARAAITEWLWSKYPATIAGLVQCSACLGFWLGLGCAAAGHQLGLALYGLPPDRWYTYLAAGLHCMVWTPVLAFVQAYSYSALSPQDGTNAESK